MTIYKKLNQARINFLKAGVKKSGVNPHQEFKYYTLQDIVPVATELCDQEDIAVIMTFDNELAKAIVTDGEEDIVFSIPMDEIAPVVSIKGNEINNAVQRRGSSVTYLRRYLWMIVLDIVEVDDYFDSQSGSVTTINNKPVSNTEREIAKDKVIGLDEKANEVMIKSLSNKINELLKAKPEEKEWVKQVLKETNNLSEVTKSQCEKFIVESTEKLNG